MLRSRLALTEEAPGIEVLEEGKAGHIDDPTTDSGRLRLLLSRGRALGDRLGRGRGWRAKRRSERKNLFDDLISVVSRARGDIRIAGDN